EVADEQIETAVAVPIDDADLGSHAGCNLFGRRSIVIVIGRMSRFDQRDALGQLWLGLTSHVAIPDHAAVAAADHQVEQSIIIPVSDDRLRVTVRGFDGLAAGLQFLGRAVNRSGVAAAVGDEEDIAFNVADEQVELAGAAPIYGEDGGSTAEVDILAVALQFHRTRELAFAPAFEEVKLARPAAGQDVADAVAVQVHKLWSEADASARGHGTGRAAGFKPVELVKPGLALGADVPV